jgi:hypothetical protein
LTGPRQLVILSGQEQEESGAMRPIGSRSDIVEKLARANTGPESPENLDVLYGPGIRIELTPHQDPINQMLVTITEEEIAWQVLTRLIHHFQWKLLDPNTNRELTPSPP